MYLTLDAISLNFSFVTLCSYKLKTTGILTLSVSDNFTLKYIITHNFQVVYIFGSFLTIIFAPDISIAYPVKWDRLCQSYLIMSDRMPAASAYI